MYRHMCLIGWLLLFGLVLAGCGTSASASTSNPPVSCGGDFTETVYRGPETGTTVQGKLTLHAEATGAVTGTLQQTVGPHVLSVVGQANGRAINLLFDLGSHGVLIGVGTMQEDLRTCKGQAGGLHG